MTSMSASPGNRIQCYRCGHVFDHAPHLSKHCLCKGCGVSISIPDGRRTYAQNSNVGGANGAAGVRAPTPHAVPLDGLLPPIARDNDGQPLPKPKPEIQAAEKPRFAADDFADIARRLKERLAAEAAARAAARDD